MANLLLVAAGSGAAALIYEIVWFQILELVIGSSTISLGILLATFMGGTCAGSLLLPRWISEKRHPLRVYAALELGIAVCAFVVLFVAPVAGRTLAVVCLLPPTILMGGTLPILARCVSSTRDGISRVGLFYGANIAGAVAGCLLSGFYLLRLYDVAAATYVAGTINAVVAAIALAVGRLPTGEEPSSGPSGHLLPDGEGHRERGSSAVYLAIALSGLCALAAEAVWTRVLGLLFGASVYTLAIILTVFLAGLGLGSAIGSLLARIVANPKVALGWCQLLIAVAIAWTAYNLGSSLPYWPIDPVISSDIRFNFQIDLNRAFWALLPPTLLWGASFPLALAAVAPSTRDNSRATGSIYAANTLGAIAGALGASLVLVAWIGSSSVQQVLIGLSIVAGLIVLLPELRIQGLAVGAFSIVIGGALIYSVPPISKVLVAHGRFAATWVGKGDIIYAREGLNSSVAVTRFPNDVLTFHVAGKIQASNVPRDMRLQRMLGHLTSLTPSHPRSVLVIGCGAGVTAGAVSIDPAVERVTVVEIEPLVPQVASTYFSKDNFDVVRNPKVRLHIDDGRHFLLSTNEKFDAITADPLDPWVKGAANLYTREFYEVVRQRLNPGGVVTMYIQLFETNTDAVKSAVATFFEVFPNGTLWGNTNEGRGHDMVLLGQVDPLRIDLDEMDRRLSTPAYGPVLESLNEIGMKSVLDLFATYAGSRSDLTEWMEGAAINRDRNLRMQYLAGTGLNLDDSARIYSDMLIYRRFPQDLFVSSSGKTVVLEELSR